MGKYTDETKILKLMPQLPKTGTSGYTATSDLVAQAITDAEAEIDGYIAGRYTLPFSSVPVQISAIADALACFYSYLYIYSADNINRNNFVESESAKYEIQLKKLKAIADGEITLTLSGGSVVEEASTSSLVDSVNKNFSPIFDIDTSTSWKADNERLEDIYDARG